MMNTVVNIALAFFVFTILAGLAMTSLVSQSTSGWSAQQVTTFYAIATLVFVAVMILVIRLVTTKKGK